MISRTGLRRTVVISVLAVLALAASVGPALAHTSLRSSDPARGAALTTAPTRVSLTFAEAVTIGRNPVSVVGADGTAWSVGPAGVSGATVSAPVQAAGPAQSYTMKWTVFSDDGDQISGSVAFTMAVAAAATPPTPAATSAPAPTAVTTPTVPATSAPPVAVAARESGGGTPIWVWALVVVAVIALVGAGLLVRARRSRAT